MALTLNSLPHISFAYTDKLVLEAYDNNMTANGSYHFSIVVGNPFALPAINYVIRPNPQLKGMLDLSPILSDILESNVYYALSAHTSPIELLASIEVTVTSRNESGATLDSEVEGPLIIVKGVEREQRQFYLNNKQYFEGGPITNYFWTGGRGKFLTNQKGARTISMDSLVLFQAIKGDSNTSTPSDYQGFGIRATYSDGTSAFDTVSVGSMNGIISINASPSMHAIINSDTVYYSVQAPFSSDPPMHTFYIDRSTKIKNRYCFLYVNSFGATDTIDFTKVSEESLSINKNVITNGRTRRQFNTTTRQTFEVYSDWMSEEASHGLRDFWNSPKVELYDSFFNKTHPVIIKNSSVSIQNRHNSKLIQYKVIFEYSKIYETQIQ